MYNHLSLGYLTVTDLDEAQGAVALREIMGLYADLADADVADALSRRQGQGVRRVAVAPRTTRSSRCSRRPSSGGWFSCPTTPCPTRSSAISSRLQLDRSTRRIAEHHKVPLSYDDAVVKLVISRCTEVESGGRMIDAILTNTMLSRISEECLTRMVEGRPLGAISLRVKDGDFSLEFA